MHFDHERIPERVVHARGAGAHGTFVGYGTASTVCKAGFLAKDKETPVFVRFSTVLGSRGSAERRLTRPTEVGRIGPTCAWNPWVCCGLLPS